VTKALELELKIKEDIKMTHRRGRCRTIESEMIKDLSDPLVEPIWKWPCLFAICIRRHLAAWLMMEAVPSRLVGGKLVIIFISLR